MWHENAKMKERTKMWHDKRVLKMWHETISKKVKVRTIRSLRLNFVC